MGSRWFICDSGVMRPADNMAWDEALLEAAASMEGPVLRFYGWTEPAATFGYFQRYPEIASWTALRPLIRRPTAGGLVPHDRDWTYSLTVPPFHEWYSVPASASYERMHLWLMRAFARIGVLTSLALTTDPAGPGQCFIGAEKADLLCEGIKIAGAAQRRNKRGLLIQGSIQPVPASVTRKDWQAAVVDEAERSWDATWQPLAGGLIAARAAELADEKYANVVYNQKR
jgi:lipoate-protein ligase A